VFYFVVVNHGFLLVLMLSLVTFFTWHLSCKLNVSWSYPWLIWGSLAFCVHLGGCPSPRHFLCSGRTLGNIEIDDIVLRPSVGGPGFIEVLGATSGNSWLPPSNG
jgi:hypothetical protein